MAFVDGNVEGEKVLDGIVFPKTFFPSSNPNDPSLPELVQTHLPSLLHTLHRHGAILFRGFRVDSPQDFASVVEAFGWNELSYEGAVRRVKKADRVYTANESPLHQFINFHHEMALNKELCSKIFFCCLEPSPEGGQTSIVRSDVVVEKMDEVVPDVVAKFGRLGMRMVWRRTSELWHRLLKTEDKLEAEERALEKLACSSVKFNDTDGTADFYYGPMNPIRDFGGKRVWFYPLLGYATDGRDPTYSFGDGNPIPSEAVDAYSRILEENCVDLDWKKGDVLLVDNLRVQHARRPGKPPRSVLVSVSK